MCSTLAVACSTLAAIAFWSSLANATMGDIRAELFISNENEPHGCNTNDACCPIAEFPDRQARGMTIAYEFLGSQLYYTIKSRFAVRDNKCLFKVPAPSTSMTISNAGVR